MTGDTVAIVSDLHLGPDSADPLFGAFESVTERFLARDPDELLVLGDVVAGAGPEADRRLLDRFVDRLDDLPIPYRVVPGNHDVDHLDLDTFEGLVGNDRWRIDPDADRVFLDSSAPRLSGSRGEVDAVQLDALKDAVADLRDAVVFVHHPVHYRSVGDNYWFGEHPEEAFCGNKRAVREVLDPAADRIETVVNGHLHAWHYDDVDGRAHFTVDSFNKRRNPRGETGAFAVLRTGEQTVFEHRAGDGTEHRVRLSD
ncbi:metallophosphoesterase family protein [Halobellus rarus]|uniref:Metallophosphoesterase family protein n=1 Tax=Halobellus rarus TaxID=1126237 RepID=A0ABD6CU03_9EURY|nr:metallophosphoesterase [Halobellus rarus]